MRVVVIDQPAPAVTWEEARVHLRLDGDDEKSLVESMIAAATGHIDGPNGWLGRAIGAQVLEARFGLLTLGQSLRLPYPPILELVSVKYLDVAGVEQTADLADFELFGDEIAPLGSDWVWLGGSLRREAARIRYRAGYEEVPAPIKAAILLMIGDLFHHRGTVGGSQTASEIPMSPSVNDLLQPYRVYR